MGIEITKKEYIQLIKAASDAPDSVICPKCGNAVEVTIKGAGQEIKCKTEGCINIKARGI